MGGNGGANQFNDVFVLDLTPEQDERVEKVAEGGPINFYSSNNASAVLNENKVVALVTSFYFVAHVIEYTLGANSVSII